MILTGLVDSLREVVAPSHIFDPKSLITGGGLLIMFLIVYGQTGLFFCFFLPSGALLFTSGLLVANGSLDHSVFTVCITLIIAAVLGNITGYWFGRKTGPLLYKRKDSRFFKHEHLKMAEDFYNKYGGLALAGGLFFPIIRTFAPIVAGMIKLKFSRFLLYTFAGSFVWIVAFVSAGYLLAIIPFLKDYLTYIVIAIIVGVTTPIVIRIIREFRKARKEDDKSEL